MHTFPQIKHCWPDQKTKQKQYNSTYLSWGTHQFIGLVYWNTKKSVTHEDVGDCTNHKSKFYTVPQTVICILWNYREL